MSAFTGSLVIEEVQPGRRWRLREPLRYEAGAKGSGLVIEVPAGFETDGATIPAALRLVLAVWGTYGRAACVHDFLYSILRGNQLWSCDPYSGADILHPAIDAIGIWPVTMADNAKVRWAADREFYIAMLACGTTRPLAWLIWFCVRVFGHRYIHGAKT